MKKPRISYIDPATTDAAMQADAVFDSLWERINLQSRWLDVRLSAIENRLLAHVLSCSLGLLPDYIANKIGAQHIHKVNADFPGDNITCGWI